MRAMAADGHGTKAVIAAFFANLGIAIMKFIGFAFTGSGAMLAEGVHSSADTGNQLLLLLGGKKARKSPDEERQFGYGRERYFWAFVVAVMLFSVGALFSIYDGIEKLQHPHELESVEWAIGILLGAIVLEIFSFRTAIVGARKVKGNSSWWRFIRTSKSPELPVVLLEDLAALLGLVFALCAVLVADATGDPMYDAIGSLTIGVLLGAVAIVLAIEMRSLLLGEAAQPEVQKQIADTIEQQPLVTSLIHLRTEHIGPDELLVAAKVEFSSDLTLQELADVVNEVETAIRRNVPEALVIYLEPDVARMASKAIVTE